MFAKEEGERLENLNTDMVKTILQHREPMLLVDEVVECIVGKWAKAKKHFTGKEEFFKGHFPSFPVVPGVLLLEALAQTGAIAVLTMKEYAGKLAFFATANNVKFRKMVLPGECVEMEVTIDHISKVGGKGRGIAWVDGQKACESSLTFAIAKGDE